MSGAAGQRRACSPRMVGEAGEGADEPRIFGLARVRSQPARSAIQSSINTSIGPNDTDVRTKASVAKSFSARIAISLGRMTSASPHSHVDPPGACAISHTLAAAPRFGQAAPARGTMAPLRVGPNSGAFDARGGAAC